MTHVRRFRVLVAASVVAESVRSAVAPSFGAATPEETVKAYLAAMKDQKFDEAYKQISKGMAANKDARRGPRSRSTSSRPAR